jgi:hypothetical protein
MMEKKVEGGRVYVKEHEEEGRKEKWQDTEYDEGRSE